MPVVGTQALGATRLPGAVVVPQVGDLATAVRPCVRALTRALVRGTVVGLRTCRHVVTVVVGALRVRFVLPLANAARAAAGGPRFVARTPIARHSTVEIPAARTPAVLSPLVGEQAVPACRNEVALPADPTAPRRARALLRAATQDWGLDDDLYEDAAMVVTELVANAVDHAGTGSTLTVDLDDRGLCVAVRDGRPDRAPRPRPVDPTAPRGRGLQMIDALTASWGVVVHTDGKTVWAVLRRRA
jgi:anti-sigma regulatory factor (Ser/Thr protein kinase)